MKLAPLRSADDLRALVDRVGLIPLFHSGAEGFSVQALTPEEYWFKDGVEGPWEWREQLAASGEVAYAKFFSGKAGFVSLSIYPHFANMRREGYDFDARVEDGLVNARDRKLHALIEGGISLSHELRKAYTDKGYEAALSRLQMRAYVTVAGFTRRLDRYGMPYGWGISNYRTAEDWFGDLPTRAYDYEPEQSRAVILDHLAPYITRAEAQRLIDYP
jgi:hypothetical protein